MEAGEESGLNSTEIAILAFTNDGEFYSDLHERNEFHHTYHLTHPDRIILTGKDSYYWAVAISLAASKFDHVSNNSIELACARSVNAHTAKLKNKYNTRTLIFSSETDEKKLFKEMLNSFIYNLDCSQITVDEVISQTQNAYESLLDKGLIEDPVEIAAGALTVGVIGLIPYGFTIKTRRGRVVYRKITAGYWDYEFTNSKGTKETSFNLRLVKMLSQFKKTFIRVSQEAIDEPDKK